MTRLHFHLLHPDFPLHVVTLQHFVNLMYRTSYTDIYNMSQQRAALASVLTSRRIIFAELQTFDIN